MLEIETLSALDHCIWLGRQIEAAKSLHTSQSTISRNLKKAQDTLASIGIVDEISAKGELVDDDQILRSQRRIHQLIRFKQAKGMRIQATCWARQLLLEPLPEAWIANKGDLGNFMHRKTLHLLNQHIIDAALVSTPEAPEANDRRYTRFHLSNQPLFLLIPNSNELSKETGLSASEVAECTRLGHSGFVSPECRAVMQRIDESLFGEQSENFASSFKEPPNHARRYGTAMTMLIRPDLARLEHQLNYPAGDILVVKRELADHPEILKLLKELTERIQRFQAVIPGLEVLC